MKIRVPDRRSDDGAMLIIALLIVTVVALVTGALLTLGNTKFAATIALRQVASDGYAADAAAKVAISDIEWGGQSNIPGATYPNGAGGTPSSWVYDANNDGAGCFGKDGSGNAVSTITLPSVYSNTQSSTTRTATVVCTPVFGTGLFSGCPACVVPPIDPHDPFARALTTVGTSTINGAADGMFLKPLGAGAEMPIKGGIQSKTSIAANNGLVRTDTSIWAASCTTSGGGAFSNPPGCPSGSYYSLNSEPAVLTSVPTYQDPSKAVGCTFQPGYYNNGATLSAAVNACSGGAHFLSGQYYFDFTDAGANWDIKTKVIGGQLTSTMSHSIPGACISPIDNASTAGVQFVFGKNSTMTLENASGPVGPAQVELCGAGNGGSAPMTIFQQQSGSTPGPQFAKCGVAPATSCTVGTVTTTATGGANQAFTVNPPTPPTNTLAGAVASPGDGLTALWSSQKANNTGELDLQNVSSLSAIPAGSSITSVKMAVNWAPGSKWSGTFTAGVSGQAALGTPTIPVPAAGAGGWSTDVDLTAQTVAQLALGTSSFTTTNPKFQLLVGGSTGKSDTLSVDGVRFTVTYIAPALRAAAIGPFINTANNFTGQFVVEGSTYAPQGYVDLRPGNNGACSPNCPLVALRWGLVAWGTHLESYPSVVFGYPIVSLPPGGGQGSAVTAVDLKVYICNGVGPCSGTAALTSRVTFTDNSSGGIVSPTPGQRQINVLSWAEQR